MNPLTYTPEPDLAAQIRAGIAMHTERPAERRVVRDTARELRALLTRASGARHLTVSVEQLEQLVRFAELHA